MKEIIWKRVTTASFSNFFIEKYSAKRNLRNTFNSCFVNNSANLAASIFEGKITFQNDIYWDVGCLSTINLTELELESAFESLKTNKKSGHDDISADVAKKVSDEIFVILKHIFNISIAKGVFPEKLKIVWVKPIFEKKKQLSSKQL